MARLFVVGALNPFQYSNTCFTVLIRNCRPAHPTDFYHTEDLVTRLVPVADQLEEVAVGLLHPIPWRSRFSLAHLAPGFAHGQRHLQKQGQVGSRIADGQVNVEPIEPEVQGRVPIQNGPVPHGLARGLPFRRRHRPAPDRRREPSVHQLDILGPPGSGEFGYDVIALPNGNIVVTDPFYDDFATVDAGAVYLYDGATGALISILTGSTTTIAWLAGGSVATLLVNNAANTPSWLAAPAAAGALLTGSTTAIAWLAGGVQGSLLYNSLANTPGWLTVGTNGQILTSNGTIPVWASITTSSAPAARSAGFCAASASFSTASTSSVRTPNWPRASRMSSG
jgi:hypothetical protein